MSISLNKENSLDILYQFIDAGHKNTGVISIKEAGLIAKYYRILKEQEEKPEDLQIVDLYKVLFTTIDVLNAKKAYTLNEASVIDSVATYLKEHIEELKDKQPEAQEEPEK